MLQEVGNAAQAEKHHLTVTFSIVAVIFVMFVNPLLSFLLSYFTVLFCVGLYLHICEDNLFGIMHSLAPCPDLNLILLTR